MRGERSPGDADAFAIQSHIAAEPFAEKIRHQVDHRIGSEGLSLFDALMGFQLEAGECPSLMRASFP